MQAELAGWLHLCGGVTGMHSNVRSDARKVSMNSDWATFGQKILSSLFLIFIFLGGWGVGKREVSGLVFFRFISIFLALK